MIVLSSITFIVMAITPPLRFLVGFVSNVIFSVVVGFHLAEIIDRKYRREVRLKHPTVFISENTKFLIHQSRIVTALWCLAGCDSGLGLHTARRLHEHGFEVYAGCLDPGSDGANVLKDMRVQVVPLDYMDEESIVQAYKTVVTHLGEKELWGIVANAGVTNYGELEWMSFDELRWLCTVNVSGTIRFLKEGIPLLRKSKGRIVIMSSVHGRMSIPGSVGASATSAALCSLADGLRRELYKWQVNVSTVEPMLYKTRITDPENVRIGINEVVNRMNPTMKEEYGQVYLDNFKNLIPKRMQKYMHINLNDVSKAVHCMLMRRVTALSVQVHPQANEPAPASGTVAMESGRRQANAPMLAFMVVALCTFVVTSLTPPLKYAVSVFGLVAFSIMIGFCIKRHLTASFGRRLPVTGKAVFITALPSIAPSLLYTKAKTKPKAQGCDSGLGQIVALALQQKGFTVFAGCLELDSQGARNLIANSVTVLHVDYLKHDTIIRAYHDICERLGGKRTPMRAGG
ncbi:hypothetical protein V5799_011291 [Amblyomma americanum]|uniref:Corticosteroid 11-beta-dehydrogenase n=1 Tax=Amblyomma americanum TaxID=6943 RepID=A0AAQ4EHC1_AMBAM